VRVKITRNQGSYKQGDIIEVSKNVAFGLIDSGIAIISKDMTEEEYKLTSDEVQADGKSTKLRTNKFK
jgi:hypothetical protein